MIPHSRPTLGDEEIREVARVLRSGRIAQGGEVEAFEEEFAEFIGVKGAVAVSSGTAALHLSLLASGIGPGRQVALPGYVCTALLNAIKFAGADPLLVDIDAQTYNLNPMDLEKRLTVETAAVIVPHMFGLPADMDGINELELPVIEDFAQAVGATCRGRKVGSMGELSVCSFYATKMLATGEGGMVASDNEDLLEKVRDLRGYDRKEQFTLRFNYKMTDLQAAMGRVQLRKLESFIERRRRIAQIYDAAVKDTKLIPPARREDVEHIFYRYVVTCPEAADEIIEELNSRGITAARPVYKPLHYYLRSSGFPAVEEVWRRAVSIPIYPSLSPEEVDTVSKALKAVA